MAAAGGPARLPDGLDHFFGAGPERSQDGTRSPGNLYKKFHKTIDLSTHVQSQGPPPAAARANHPDSFWTGTPVKRSSLLPSLSGVNQTHGVTKISKAVRAADSGTWTGREQLPGALLTPSSPGRSPGCDRDSERGAETWERHGMQPDGQTTTAATPRRGPTGRGMRRRRDSSGSCSGRAIRPVRSRPGPRSSAEAVAGSPEPEPGPAPGMPPGRPARWSGEQAAVPASGPAPGVSFDWASWTRRRWDLPQREGG